MVVSIGENLTSGIRALEAAGNGNARSEACWMLEELLEVSAAGLSTRLQQPLPEGIAQVYGEQIRRRASGEPLQYVIGNVDFFNVRLEIGPGVLIPRPETEELVEFVVETLFNGASPTNICDVCTGSGAIALALATAFPNAHVCGTDISREALAWAEKNLVRLALGNVTLLHGDLFAPLPHEARFELITANPPYVSQSAYEGLETVIKDYEPRLALVAEDDGLALLKRIVKEARNWLLPKGWLVCEIGDDQGDAIREILEKEGYEDISIRQDMAHRDRMAIGRKAR